MSSLSFIVNGTISTVNEIVELKKKDGEVFQKQQFLVKTEDKYNNLYLFELLGNKNVENFNTYNKVGDNVEVNFNVKTSEHNQKYYITLNAWKVTK